jgi:hypothetical protein
MQKMLFYYKFIKYIYMFRALYSHRQEVKILLYSLWYHHTYRWPSGAQVDVLTMSTCCLKHVEE